MWHIAFRNIQYVPTMKEKPLSMSLSYKSCLTVCLEFPWHSSLPASMKEQPLKFKGQTKPQKRLVKLIV